MAFREAAHIFKTLRNGAVPKVGLEAFAVGIERPRKELQRKLDEAKSGEGDVKFLRGGYGCGKTFMANLLAADAQKQKFVTSFVVVSDNDFHFHKFEELYRKVVQSLSTPACPTGALGDILDRWIGGIEDALVRMGVSEGDPAFDEKILAKLDEQLVAMTGGLAPPDMIRVVRKIFELKQANRPQDAAGLISWLSGSENVAASIKALAGIRGDITSSDAMAYLRGVLEIIKSAGYEGLVIIVDEAETILRQKSDVRGKSLNAIRQIVDAASDYPKLLWAFTGTPQFFDDRHGVKGLQPLHDRIQFSMTGTVANLRQPQLNLEPFNRERLVSVGMKLRSLHPELAPEEVERRLPKELIEQLVDNVTKGFGGDVGVVPRQFLRKFVDLLDVLVDNPDADAHELLGFTPIDPNDQEKAVLAGRSLEEPPPDDGFGGAAVDM
jgi:hypothetical protein